MNHSEFMNLMRELDIPEENIIEYNEPQHSLEILQFFEEQYNLDSSDLLESSGSYLRIPSNDYEDWLAALEKFEEYHGDKSLINTCKKDFIKNDSDYEEAEFTEPASFFVQ
ncbi:hypothetical protein [Lactiplantibacillus plantarum]|uniref:hypothetical protein n=1 Tax=Lactiplantibacillus plantarum TaxID=1590 RepID=UPI00264B99F3|nr:hypothetical protein [Lactiplantibacillus plantarum]MDN7014469.1 hypothetical protein [Lactiplantibacillus plantarum]MDN7048010.1 hypothetical protein [Lactiplantibacillus plantarum]MDN7051093.1 hypothetical protein [Lactiplantibacillus plantarum]MDN7054096.1 hypothetical protein [Lactiplantibacillus plantarum]MDN7057170.1 hypothetical protein [Lactiplantibacillus plantarum]